MRRMKPLSSGGSSICETYIAWPARLLIYGFISTFSKEGIVTVAISTIDWNRSYIVVSSLFTACAFPWVIVLKKTSAFCWFDPLHQRRPRAMAEILLTLSSKPFGKLSKSARNSEFGLQWSMRVNSESWNVSINVSILIASCFISLSRAVQVSIWRCKSGIAYRIDS